MSIDPAAACAYTLSRAYFIYHNSKGAHPTKTAKLKLMNGPRSTHDGTGPRAPKPPQGVPVPGHAGLVINKLSIWHET